jgi:ribosomal-protein-alanine N-acetyltransferase
VAICRPDRVVAYCQRTALGAHGMQHITAQVRQAEPDDAAPMQRMLERSTRQYVAFGPGDLPYLLAQRRVWLAGAANTVWGFLCVLPRSAAVADVRALALINGWATDIGVQTLLGPAMTDLQGAGTKALLCFGVAAWLVPPLQRAGFQVQDRVVYFEREAGTLAARPQPSVTIRPVGSADLSILLELDGEAFDWLWRFDQGHFMELLVTRGHSVMAVRDGRAVGYAISDVAGEAGFVIRLAVHPDFRQQGIGGDLLADALAYCEASGATTVRLNTQDGNMASHRLYRRFGFEPAGRRVPVLMTHL